MSVVPEHHFILATAVAKMKGGCALTRLRDHLDRPEHLGLSLVAREIGFVDDEPFGIMDGWDEAFEPGCGVYRFRSHKPGYADGYRLGQTLHVLSRDKERDELMARLVDGALAAPVTPGMTADEAAAYIRSLKDQFDGREKCSS